MHKLTLLVFTFVVLFLSSQLRTSSLNAALYAAAGVSATIALWACALKPSTHLANYVRTCPRLK